MTTPLVTIITPTYNRASYLDETIQSVLGQDYPNLEYVVLDDGSTDNSREVLAKYDGRITWETHANMGETRTVNKGFGMARGEIIGVVNSDDPLLPGAISRLVQCLQEHPEVVVAYPDWKMIDAKGKTIRHVTAPDYSYTNMIGKHLCMAGPGTLFRREMCETLHGRDPQFGYVADFDFWLRAGLLGQFKHLAHTLATFRIHPNSASLSQTGARMAEEHIRLIEKIYAMPGLSREILESKKEAFCNAYFSAGYTCGNLAGPRRRYYRRSLLYCPWKHLTEYRGRLLLILPAVFRFPPQLVRSLSCCYDEGRSPFGEFGKKLTRHLLPKFK